MKVRELKAYLAKLDDDADVVVESVEAADAAAAFFMQLLKDSNIHIADLEETYDRWREDGDCLHRSELYAGDSGLATYSGLTD